MNKKKIYAKIIIKSIVIFIILVIPAFVTKCTAGRPFFYDLEIIIEKTEVQSGEDVRVIVNAIHNKSLNEINNSENVILKFETDNEYVDIDEATSRSAPFVNGVSRSIVRLINRKRDTQKTNIIARYKKIKAQSKSEIVVKPYIYNSGRSIYSHIPQKEKVKVLSNVLKNPTFGSNKLNNIIVLGTDHNNNFFIYLKKPENLVLKISSDGSLITIIIEEELINLIQGDVIAGAINKETRRLYLLKSNDENKQLSLMFFDVSGNLRSKPIVIGKIDDIISKYVNRNFDMYTFEAIELDVIKNKIAVVIREILPNKPKISSARPTLIILDKNGNVENVILTNPPKITSFGNSYWEKTTADKLHFQTFIRKDNIYVLWGSGYTENSSIGYIIQKLSISGREINSFTRLITRVPVPYDEDSIYNTPYSKAEEQNYIARGLYVDEDKRVYAFIELGKELYIDVFSEQDIYEENIHIETTQDIGELTLIGKKNVLVYNNKVIISTDKGIFIFELSKEEKPF